MAKPLKFRYSGIPKIKIPKNDNDFVNSANAMAIIDKYLPSILQKHKANREKIKYLYNYAFGDQDISEKKRLYNKDAANNNQIIENHAFRQVSFKTGFITSEKRDYAHKSDSHSNDTIFLDRYLTDCNFYSKDKDIKEFAFATGIATSYQCPRTDIITEDVDLQSKELKYRYKKKDEGFDIETESPVSFDVVDPADNFVVYSSIRGEVPLFCISLVQVEKKDSSDYSDTEFDYELYIETRYARFKTRCSKSFGLYAEENLKLEVEKTFHDMPMVEHYYNRKRLGLVELNRALFNSINTVVSNVTDMIVDGANVILVFKNTDIDQSTIDDMKNKGAIILHDVQDNVNQSEAKLDVIRIEIPFDGLNSFYEERLTQAYDIAGVPLASGNVTSGGDTGQARLLGGGWNNAYIIIKNDITSFLECDYTVLKSFLKICKLVPNCPIKDLAASQIDIKYHINQSDNLLVKAQSISQLYQVNMPKEEILKATGLFSDICTVANKWEQVDRLAKENKLKSANADTNKSVDNNVDTNSKQDNTSKE
uniref:Portal n=1 Tax=Siphoviridae sp. ctFn287 TaxID=2826215 RepID=A0A8S5LV49_9CAUD|nr:MAG TPA: Portal [Siphoviridae sp. ctFn287]